MKGFTGKRPRQYERQWLRLTKPVPAKACKNEYMLHLVEAFCDILEGDESYLKRLMNDAKRKEVVIINYKSEPVFMSFGKKSYRVQFGIHQGEIQLKIGGKLVMTDKGIVVPKPLDSNKAVCDFVSSMFNKIENIYTE